MLYRCRSEWLLDLLFEGSSGVERGRIASMMKQPRRKTCSSDLSSNAGAVRSFRRSYCLNTTRESIEERDEQVVRSSGL